MAKAKSTRRPAPDNFKPITRDDVSDLAAVPRMLSLHMTETRMSFQGLTFSNKEIKDMVERLTRYVEQLDGRVVRVEGRTDRLEEGQRKLADEQRQMNERIERLEGEAKKGQGQ